MRVDPVLTAAPVVFIYRYCSIGEALAIVKSGKMTFAHPSVWKDKFEHEVQNQIFDKTGRFAHHLPLVKCVSLEKMSEAMWRIYAGAGGLVRLRFKLQSLLAALDKASWHCNGTLLPDHKIYCGPVRYMPTSDLRKEVSAFGARIGGSRSSAASAPALLAKRDAFQFENEVRIVLMLPGRRGALSADKLKQLVATAKTKRISEAVDQILVDPYLPTWQAIEQCSAWRLLRRRRAAACEVRQSLFDAGP